MVKISNTQISSFNNTSQPDRLVFNTQIQAHCSVGEKT